MTDRLLPGDGNRLRRGFRMSGNAAAAPVTPFVMTAGSKTGVAVSRPSRAGDMRRRVRADAWSGPLRAACAAAVCATLVIAPMACAQTATVPDAAAASGNAAASATAAYLGIDGSADVQYRMDAVDAARGNGTQTVAAQSGAAWDDNVDTAEKADLPWKVTVLFSKDGPEVDAAALVGASGTIGVEIRLRARDGRAQDLIPVVAFSVPLSVTDEVTGTDGTTVTDTGKELLVRAIGQAGDADFRFTMDAKDFTLGQIAIAGVPASASADAASDGAAAGNVGTSDDATVTARALALASSARTFADAQTGAGSEADQQLIASLQAMRDDYLAKAKADDEATDKAYYQELSNYMATFSQAYAGHLSGAPGDSTQMGAVAQLYSDLNGDTPMAHVVTSIAAAVDARSDARRADGAADALDEMITRIKRQGSAGLADELKKQVGTENTGGDTDYKKGQDQLRAAMIPYSMAYLDAYTKNLNAQVQAGQSIAGGHQAAVDATNSGWEKGADAAGYHRQIAAALDTLAAARERNGKAEASKRVLEEFAGQLKADDGASGADAGSGAGSVAGVPSGPAAQLASVANPGQAQGSTAWAASSGEGIVPALRKAWGGSASVPSLRRDASWLIDDVVGVSQGADVLSESLTGGAEAGAGQAGDGTGAVDGWMLALPEVDAQSASDGGLRTSAWTKLRRFLSLD